jgi:hypothetical protein
MRLLERIVCGLARLGLVLAGCAIWALGVAGLSLWLSSSYLDAPDAEPWVDALRSFSGRLAAVGWTAGPLILVALWPIVPIPLRAPSHEDSSLRGERPGWLALFPWSQGGLALATLAAAGPLLAWWRDALALLHEWGAVDLLTGGGELSGMALPAGIVLLVPGFEGAAGLSFVTGAAVSIALYGLESPLLPRAVVAWFAVQLAWVVASFCALDFVGVVAGAVEAALEAEGGAPLLVEGEPLRAWIARHDAAVRPTAHTWLAVALAFGAWVPPMLASDRIARVFARPSRRPAPGPVPQPRLRPRHAASPRSLLPDRGGASALSQYRARLDGTVLTSFFRPSLGYEIAARSSDGSTSASLRARRVIFGGAGAIRVWHARHPDREVLRADQIGAAPARYEVRTAAGLLGRVRRGAWADTTWVLEDSLGSELARAERTRVAWRRVEYRIVSGDALLGSVLWTLEGLTPCVELDLRLDRDAALDRRLALALAIVLEATARWRHHVYLQPP